MCPKQGRTTTKERSTALKQFERRKQENSKIVRMDNARLRAGSPMYYYCKGCGAEMVLSESHTCPVPNHCGECNELLERGWLPK